MDTELKAKGSSALFLIYLKVMEKRSNVKKSATLPLGPRPKD